MDPGLPILVIGAGVAGLTTAVTLAEAGHPAQVYTAEPPEATASAVAGALWGPWLVEPRQRVLRWAEHSLTTLSDSQPTPGLACASPPESTSRACITTRLIGRTSCLAAGPASMTSCHRGTGTARTTSRPWWTCPATSRTWATGYVTLVAWSNSDPLPARSSPSARCQRRRRTA